MGKNLVGITKIGSVDGLGSFILFRQHEEGKKYGEKEHREMFMTVHVSFVKDMALQM